MRFHFLAAATPVALIAVLLTACAPASPAAGGMNYSRLVDDLKKNGATVSANGELSQPFFSVDGKIIKVNGEDVQVFEYKDEASMQADASQVSPSGSPIGTTMVTWVAPPHFFKSGRLIVIYIGESASVKSALEKVLGAQFAGR